MNLNIIEKKTMPLTFRNGENGGEGKTIHILTPSKAMFDQLLNDSENGKTIKSKFDESYEKAAELMSRNKECYTVEKEWLETQMDIEEIVLFYSEYTEFVLEIRQSPN